MLRSDHSAFSSGLPSTWLTWLALGLVTAVVALGCKPQIGDKCTVSTNCSSTGDRLCDVTQPDGYCTKFNCEPGSCPEDSVCVNFGTTLSPLEGCAPSQGNSPYKRSFCMANCGSNGDCRAGYECLDPKNDLHAVLAEYSSGQRVCAVRPNPSPTLYVDSGTGDAGAGGAPPGNSNQVCIGSDAGPAAGGSSSSGGSGGGSGGTAGGSSSGGGSAGASGDGGAAGDAGAHG